MSAPQPWRCEGPKLETFRFKDELQCIIGYIGGGLHSHVFQVCIDGSIYALKMFKFLSLGELWPYSGSELTSIDPKVIFNHSDPFNSECRAYGRLKETGCEDLAVKAYGYIFIDDKHEELVAKRFLIEDWGRNSKKHKAIRAIVKQYIKPGPHFTPRMIPKMMENLSDINRLGIQV